MKRYVMRQKLLSIGNDFTVKDDAGNEVYYIDGKVFTLRDQLSFQDMAGNQLCLIQKKLLSWGPTYEIYKGDTLWAVVKEQLFTMLGHKFYVDVPGPDDLEAAGNFTDHEYTFTQSGQTAATVSKKWFAIADTFGVEILADQEDVLILAATVVIERCAQQGRKQEDKLGKL